MRRLALFLTLAIAFPAYAQPDKPQELSALIKAEQPYGQAKLKKLFLSIYDGQIWTDAPQWSMDVPYALTLRYHMNFTAVELAQRSVKEMESSQTLTPEERSAYEQQLSKAFPDVHPDDRISAFYHPDKGVRFFYNGKLTGAITDRVFAKRFMGIWLSEKTSEPEFRQALIEKSSAGSM